MRMNTDISKSFMLRNSSTGNIITALICIPAVFLSLQLSGQITDSIKPCSLKIFDSRDSTFYSTVLIGTRCWMAENLNTGTRISLLKDQRDNGIIEKYCYDNKEENCKIYGGLYQWDEMMQYDSIPGSGGICLPGWQIPSAEDWCILSVFLDPTVRCDANGATGTIIGARMRSTGTIEDKTGSWYKPNVEATNESGFTVLPAGTRSIYSKFFYLGYHGYFWTSSSYNKPDAWFRYFKYSNTSIYQEHYFKASGYSVRCVRRER
jgi:uncharacterized protein (TIGR02145 family)